MFHTFQYVWLHIHVVSKHERYIDYFVKVNIHRTTLFLFNISGLSIYSCKIDFPQNFEDIGKICTMLHIESWYFSCIKICEDNVKLFLICHLCMYVNLSSCLTYYMYDLRYTFSKNTSFLYRDRSHKTKYLNISIDIGDDEKRMHHVKVVRCQRAHNLMLIVFLIDHRTKVV